MVSKQTLGKSQISIGYRGKTAMAEELVRIELDYTYTTTNSRCSSMATEGSLEKRTIPSGSAAWMS